MDKDKLKNDLRRKATMRSAPEQGPKALFEEYVPLIEGGDSAKDRPKAVSLLRSSAQSGYLPALGEYGRLLGEGEGGVPKDIGKSFEMELQAAKGGFIPSVLTIAKTYFTGRHHGEVTDLVPEADVDEAVGYWEMAGDNVEARLNIAKLMIMGLGMDQDCGEALKILNELIGTVGDDDARVPLKSEALFWKGYLYYYGLGVMRFKDNAMKFFRKATQCEIPFGPASDVVTGGVDPKEALLRWGHPYDGNTWYTLFVDDDTAGDDGDAQEEEEEYEVDEYGNRIGEDDDLEESCYEDPGFLALTTPEVAGTARAAMRGDPASLYEVAELIIGSSIIYKGLLEMTDRTTPDLLQMLEHGMKVSLDNKDEAIGLLLPPAMCGNTSAMYFLGTVYDEYTSMVEDPKLSEEYCNQKAFEWFLKGACNDNAACCEELGSLYFGGIVPGPDGAITHEHDYCAAAFWYEEALDTSDSAPSRAYYTLGRIYKEGLIDGKVDMENAVKYFTMDTERYSDTCSWYELGLCYELGLGVDKDISKAMECYRAAGESLVWKDAGARLAYLQYTESGLLSVGARRKALATLRELAPKCKVARDLLQELGKD